MKAAFYESFGPASEVLRVEEIPTPTPRAGEVLVRVHASGVNPSDVKLRAGARPGAVMPAPRVVPHSDGAGVIEAVGEGVDPGRVGQRVWIWNGQWRRAFGTGAEYIALPAEQAVPLPEGTSFEEAACLGIPAMTAWMALFNDGPIAGQRVLVTGGAGTVGRYAIQMARLGGASAVYATASGPEKAAHAGHTDATINYRSEDVAARIIELTGGKGVDRIVDVDFGGNLATSRQIIAEGGTIASYASMGMREPALPFYDLMFRNIRLHMLIVYLLDPVRRRQCEAAINHWLAAGQLSHAVAASFPLDRSAEAHQAVEAGEKLGSVVVSM